MRCCQWLTNIFSFWKKNVIRYKVQNKPVRVLFIQGLFNCAMALLSEFKLLIEKFNFFFLLHLNLKCQR